jgi:hypothetical protein
MIAYDLECDGGHVFEGWFDNADGFDRQCRDGLVTCPVCASGKVTRMLSTFGIAKHRDRTVESPARNPNPFDKIVKFLEENFDDVGTDFAREALKMHYGVTDYRNIRGVSTEQEEKTLQEEGIRFFKVPAGAVTPPEDE